jgi:hypothetical protein
MLYSKCFTYHLFPLIGHTTESIHSISAQFWEIFVVFVVEFLLHKADEFRQATVSNGLQHGDLVLHIRRLRVEVLHLSDELLLDLVELVPWDGLTLLGLDEPMVHGAGGQQDALAKLTVFADSIQVEEGRLGLKNERGR